MKRYIGIVLTIILSITALSACGQSLEEQWQEQYDLGIRYLSEGNYEEAIIAFTAAIEIDPNRAEAYVGRGDAYVASGETVENLATALEDYEAALSIDSTFVDIYIKIARIYDLQDNFEQAEKTLEKGLEITGDERLDEFLKQIAPSNFETFEGYVRFENADNAIQKAAVDLVTKASDGATWEELFYFLESQYESDLPEFYVEHAGWKIHYAPGFIEMRQENGKAFSYDFGSPDSYVSGHTKSWNWCGELARYLVYPWIEEGVVLGGPGSGFFVSITEEGLYDGLGYSEIYNVEDGSIWRERWHSTTYENGYCIYNNNLKDPYPNTKLDYQNPAKNVSGNYENYEDFAKNELWD